MFDRPPIAEEADRVGDRDEDERGLACVPGGGVQRNEIP
jgi:hypothetical protein